MRLIFSLIILLLSTSGALAGELLSAPDALEQSRSGKLILIDVRRPSEWRESGIAEPAIPLSMHERGFLEGLEAIRAANPEKKIALICATGGRTSFLQSELAKRGLGTVVDVSEGMFGNGRAPGWLKRGLPIKKHDG